MNKIVALNNLDHYDLRVLDNRAALEDDAVNQILVFPTEFEEAQREYPILFRRNKEGGFQSVLLLGFDRDENLFIEGDRWSARYIPAIRQRGPFLIGFADADEDGAPRGEPKIYVDLDHPRIGRSDGVPLFLPQGGNAPHLNRVIEVLRTIHEGRQISGLMFDAFQKADLMEPIMLQVSIYEGRRYNLPDCYTIGADRLAALDSDRLEALHRCGFLRAAFMVAASIANMDRLIDLKNNKLAAAGDLMREPM